MKTEEAFMNLTSAFGAGVGRDDANGFLCWLYDI